MTKAEVARLLAMIAAFDRRTIGEADVEAWHLILADLDTNDCANAVRDHYATQRDWIMPADVRNAAVRTQRKRAADLAIAEREAQIEAENGGVLAFRTVPAITAGTPVPSAANLMRQEVARNRKPAAAIDTTATQAARERREQARAELERLRGQQDTA
jgi:hypothetical protein